MSYDVIVVGRGLLGAAAARHIADAGATVALVGPGEPANRRDHTGVFGAHYDSSRIMRTIDRDPYYAAIAAASVERFQSIEQRSDIRFFHPVGHLAVSPLAEYRDALVAQAAANQVDHDELVDRELAEQFPMLSFSPGMTGIYERSTGGWIDPRRLIAAQCRLVEGSRGTVIDRTVTDIRNTTRGAEVTTDEGSSLSGRKVLLATGAFANHLGIIPKPVLFEIELHTVLLAEVSDASRLRGMPSVIYKRGTDVGESIYVLPPVDYPDGRVLLKIGHSTGHLLDDREHGLIPWFQADGDPAIASWLTEELAQIVPDVSLGRSCTESCVVTRSPTERQFIDRFDGTNIYSLLADNGQVAKSSDELGRIAASRVLTGQVPPEYRDVDYRLRYA